MPHASVDVNVSLVRPRDATPNPNAKPPIDRSTAVQRHRSRKSPNDLIWSVSGGVASRSLADVAVARRLAEYSSLVLRDPVHINQSLPGLGRRPDVAETRSLGGARRMGQAQRIGRARAGGGARRRPGSGWSSGEQAQASSRAGSGAAAAATPYTPYTVTPTPGAWRGAMGEMTPASTTAVTPGSAMLPATTSADATSAATSATSVNSGGSSANGLPAPLIARASSARR